jgi:hypothetical protein
MRLKCENCWEPLGPNYTIWSGKFLCSNCRISTEPTQLSMVDKYLILTNRLIEESNGD